MNIGSCCWRRFNRLNRSPLKVRSAVQRVDPQLLDQIPDCNPCQRGWFFVLPFSPLVTAACYPSDSDDETDDRENRSDDPLSVSEPEPSERAEDPGQPRLLVVPSTKTTYRPGGGGGTYRPWYQAWM